MAEEFGLSSKGFRRKPLDVILDELNAQLRASFGDNFNTNPESPDGQIIGVIAEALANLWEVSEQSYNSFNPSGVTGATQDNLYQLNNVFRLEAKESRVELTLTGVAGTNIIAGSFVSTTDKSLTFATEIAAVIGGGGSVTVFASATETGPFAALAGTVTQIDSPITGWLTATNLLDAFVGSDLETDPDNRARRDRSTAIAAQSVIDSIEARVLNVQGVTQVRVLDNVTLVIDANGLLPKSTGLTVIGGDDNKIAEVYFITKTEGIATNGTTVVQVFDNQGIPHEIRFQRPTLIDIYVIVNLTTNADYPADGDDLIKQAIVDYANGVLVDNRGFSLNEDVIYTRLFTPVNLAAPGHEIDDLFIGIAPAPTGIINIPIGLTEISNFLNINIVVNS